MKNNYINDISSVDNIDFTNPNKFKFLNDLTLDSYTSHFLDNTFCVFISSINNELYLVYSNKNKSIICFNLINNKKINEIKNAHEKYISNFRYFFDKINKRDLVFSISSQDNNIKLWNINKLECIFNFIKINKIGRLISACFLNYNNIIYIVTTNSNYPNNGEPIKIFDFNGNKLNEINDDNNNNTFFIDIYYDKKLSKNYIITGHFGFIKSYDYNEGKIYHNYNDNDKRRHYSLIINEEDTIIKLIDSSCDGNIRIWNFHSGELLNKINIEENMLFGICLWNNRYLFVGSMDNTIKILDLIKGEKVRDLIGYNNMVICVKIIIHPIYGKCILIFNLDNI